MSRGARVNAGAGPTSRHSRSEPAGAGEAHSRDGNHRFRARAPAGVHARTVSSGARRDRLHLLPLWKAAGRLLRVGEITVHGDLEHAARTLHQLDVGAVDPGEPVAHTERFGFIPSSTAIFDPELHRSLSVKFVLTPRKDTFLPIHVPRAFASNDSGNLPRPQCRGPWPRSVRNRSSPTGPGRERTSPRASRRTVRRLDRLRVGGQGRCIAGEPTLRHDIPA